MGGSPVAELLGILGGHVYHFLKDIHPRSSGKQYLHTPAFIHQLFPNPNVNVNANAFAPRNVQRNNWGAGFALGN